MPKCIRKHFKLFRLNIKFTITVTILTDYKVKNLKKVRKKYITWGEKKEEEAYLNSLLTLLNNSKRLGIN